MTRTRLAKKKDVTSKGEVALESALDFSSSEIGSRGGGKIRGGGLH